MIVTGLAAARRKNENNPRKKKGRKKLWVAFGLATLVLIASASFFLFHRWGAKDGRTGVPSLPIEIPIPDEEAQKKEIQLFFSSADEENLAPESREIRRVFMMGRSSFLAYAGIVRFSVFASAAKLSM